MRLCIDFGGTTIKVGVFHDGRAASRDSATASREFPVAGTENDLVTAEATARELIVQSPEALTGIAIALPGVVDRAAGRMIAAHGKYAYLDGVNVAAWAESLFGAPAVIENDARAALLGETSGGGCASGATDAVMVTLGTGIGTAAIMDGHLIRGAHDHAGILGGHVTVDIDADRCPCGNIGCAESLASTWALRNRLGRHPDHERSTLSATFVDTGETGDLGLDLGLKDVIAAATGPAPDAVARDLLHDFVRIWGAAIVSLCHAYDPNVVIVSGGAMRAKDVILPQLEAYVREHLWSSSHRPALVSPEAPELSVLRGLSVLAAEAARAASNGSDGNRSIQNSSNQHNSNENSTNESSSNE